MMVASSLERRACSAFSSTRSFSLPFSLSVFSRRFSIDPELRDELLGGLLADAGDAGDVVGGVAHEAEDVDDLLGALDVPELAQGGRGR